MNAVRSPRAVTAACVRPHAVWVGANTRAVLAVVWFERSAVLWLGGTHVASGRRMEGDTDMSIKNAIDVSEVLP